MCVDFRRLNEITKDIEYPLPSIDVLLDCLGGSKIWTSLDLSTGYHQVRMEPESIPMTSFKTQLGQYSFQVMPFGLKTAPATFQRLMNKVLEPHKNDFVLAYLDDILVHSKSLSDHLRDLDEVLRRLAENDLRLNPKKCFWGKNELEYLGHVLNAEGIKPSESKCKAVKEWPTPTCVRDVQSFTGFTNYYRRYIKDYSKIAIPLYELTRKGVQFKWTAECTIAFQKLKQALCTAPVLLLPKTGTDAEFVVSTDASKYAIGAVLLQKDDASNLRPCAFFAKTLSKAQTSYSTYEQELLAVCCALHEWSRWIDGSKKITVVTDHATLRHLPKRQNPKDSIPKRYTTWFDTFNYFGDSLEIVYRKGTQNEADALSRRPDLKYYLNQYDENTFEQDLESTLEFLGGMYHLQDNASILTQVREGYKTEHQNYHQHPINTCVPAQASYRLPHHSVTPRRFIGMNRRNAVDLNFSNLKFFGCYIAGSAVPAAVPYRTGTRYLLPTSPGARAAPFAWHEGGYEYCTAYSYSYKPRAHTRSKSQLLRAGLLQVLAQRGPTAVPVRKQILVRARETRTHASEIWI